MLKPGLSEAPIVVLSHTKVALGGRPVVYRLATGRSGFMMASYAPQKPAPQQGLFDQVMTSIHLGAG